MNSCASVQVNSEEGNLFITSGEEEPLAVLGVDWLQESPDWFLCNVFVIMECGVKIPIEDYLLGRFGRPEDDSQKQPDIPVHLL